MTRPDTSGVVGVLAAALLWGSIGVLSVALFRLGLTPWEVAFWRAALSCVALLVLLAALRPRDLRLASPRDAGILGAFGLISVALFYASFQLATYLTSVAVAVVLLYTAPILVLAGAWLFLGEPLGLADLGIAALVVAGVALTALGAVGAEVRVSVQGVAWGLVAALSYSAYYLFGRRCLPRFGVFRTLFYSLLSGTLALGAALAAAGRPPRLGLPLSAWALLLALALGTTLLANALYYRAIQRIAAGRAAVVASIEPVVAALLALALLGQRLTAVGWLGVLLVVFGVATAPGRRRA